MLRKRSVAMAWFVAGTAYGELSRYGRHSEMSTRRWAADTPPGTGIDPARAVDCSGPAPGSRKRTGVVPTRIMSPSSSRCRPAKRSPFTKEPLLDSPSSLIVQLSPTCSTRACRRDTSLSQSSAMALLRRRPIVTAPREPGSTQMCWWPDTSRKTRNGSPARSASSRSFSSAGVDRCSAIGDSTRRTLGRSIGSGNRQGWPTTTPRSTSGGHASSRRSRCPSTLPKGGIHMIRSRITFANVTSFVALFVALSAGSYAAIAIPANSVGTKQIKAKAVTSAKLRLKAVTRPKVAANAIDGSKVKDGSLTGADINLGTLGKVPAAATADTAAAATIARVKTVSAAGTSRADSGEAPIDAATASCDQGLVAVGGGVSVSDPSNQFVVDSFPNGTAAWSAHVANFSAGTPSFTISVICAPAAATQ